MTAGKARLHTGQKPDVRLRHHHQLVILVGVHFLGWVSFSKYFFQVVLISSIWLWLPASVFLGRTLRAALF